MTHIRNLPMILAQGRIICDKQAAISSLTQQSIGHSHIKQRRASCQVNCGPGGFLCDYVPFYFHHHSPMLYVISKSGVTGYNGGQDEVVYLVSSTKTIAAYHLPFVFTDGHAAMALTVFYQNLSDLDKLDWNTIRAIHWANTDVDGDKARRKQAEFLVYNYVPWPMILGIVVKTQLVAEQVADCLVGQQYIPPIKIMTDWYY